MPTDEQRQDALDRFERSKAAARMGRALLEWSGIDPTDAASVESFAQAIGWSSIPEACRTIAEASD